MNMRTANILRLDNIRASLNEEIDRLEDANLISNEPGTVEYIKILTENYESDMNLIEQELEEALEE